MPELPEVETTKNGLIKLIVGQTILSAHIYQPQLRWQVPEHLIQTLKGQKIIRVSRRGKYLLIELGNGALVMHLGMSGSIGVVHSDETLKKHQHFELKLSNSTSLRFLDPRRFGAIVWQKPNEVLTLLRNLGPEPLSEAFDATTLYKRSRGKKQNVKAFIMDSHVVVGVGNIYASESLFVAGISPKRQAGRISIKRYQALTLSIKKVLEQAIKQGGTTLQDFSGVNGQLGYFAQKLAVYGRQERACNRCDGTIQKIVQNQRATYYCAKCQT